MPDEKFSFGEEAFKHNDKRPRKLTPSQIEEEKNKCREDVVYFVNTYCKIYDSLTSSWVPFTLWPAQIELLRSVMAAKYSLIPKARQLGISWLLGDVLPLYYMLFRPVAEILLFSQRDDEAIKLLERIKGTDESVSTFKLLPDWMKPKVVVDNSHEFKLDNGSRIQALPSTAGGRSNTVTYCIIDEADFIPNLKSLITAAKPTIDAGNNKMVVLSTINEETPNSYFQRLCTANMNSDAGWKLMFLGWMAHPGRDENWYEDKKASTLVDNGTLDPLYKEYPATLKEALAPRELNKRFPPQWIMELSAIRKPVPVHADMPPHPNLKIYKVPESGHTYGIGVDPGGGVVDKSVAQVIDKASKEQVAVLAGLVEPTQFANQVADLAVYYFGAAVLFELNNHGHAFLAQSKERGVTLRRGVNRRGVKDREPGWLTTERTKHTLYDIGFSIMQEAMALAETFGGAVVPILCDATTVAELQSIEVSTLEAPEGMFDDHAMAWLLGQACVHKDIASVTQSAYSGLWHKRDAEKETYQGPGGPRVNVRVPEPVKRDVPTQKRPITPTSDEDAIPDHIRRRFGRY